MMCESITCENVIDSHGVDYIVTDGEDMLKHCPDVCNDDNYQAALGGYGAVMGAVRAQRPKVVFEACEDGGNMETFAMAALADTSNSCDDGPSYTTRMGAWGHTYPFSPRYAAKYAQDLPSNYTYRSAAFGGPLILMQRLSEFTAGDMATAVAAVAEYKQLRDALWADDRVAVHHLEPPLWPPSTFPPPPLMPACLSDDATGGVGWDAIQAVSGDGRFGAAFVFRAQLGNDTHTLMPRGLLPSATYRVASTDGRWSPTTGTGHAIMMVGVNVSLEQAGSDVVTFTAT